MARQPQQTGCFSKLPMELALKVNLNLTIIDKLSLADTCSTYRPLISDAECTRACTMAGLSIPPDVTAREMAKLLCRPRVGVCNWSYQGGVPKSGLNDFSKVIPTSSAIREKIPVDLHPVFEPTSRMYLHQTSAFEMVHLRVAKDEPELLIFQHRLYLNEYATSPPLDELHVSIREDEGPIFDGDVAFRIRNPKGVTLGNYYQGLFRLFVSNLFASSNGTTGTYCSLHAAPDPKMALTRQLLAQYNYFASARLRLDCPTNLAMLDAWYKSCQQPFLFSEKALTCILPLYRGMLTLVIYPENPKIAEDDDFIDYEDIEWGEPQREPDTILFIPVSNEELWKDTPVIMF